MVRSLPTGNIVQDCFGVGVRVVRCMSKGVLSLETGRVVEHSTRNGAARIIVGGLVRDFLDAGIQHGWEGDLRAFVVLERKGKVTC